MIEDFISALQNTVHDITPEEVADILWLATHMDNEGETGNALLNESNASKQNEIASTNADDLTGGTLAKTVEELSKKVGLFPRRSGNGTNAGVPFKVPAASALPGALDIGRALRPLMRKVPSQFASVIDEQATADRIAEEKLRFPLARTLWLPTLVPARRRWLEVALIIDTHSSMLIWQQTIFELQHLLEQQGAFRDVRSWKLVVDAQNASHVWLQTTADSTVSKSQKRRIEELLDPAGQRLFLIVTDCVSPLWQNDTMRNVVRTWGQNNPVTLVQMLPERFWRRTGLRMATPVRLKVPFPGAPNRSLQVISTKYRDDLLPERGFSVPVVTLHPEALAVWARWLAGDAEASTPGFVLEEKEVSEVEVVEPAEVSAQQLVRRFRATASPIARKLAGLVAAAPVSLPVVRLIQRAMLPEALQVHVAELFLSGLLEQETTTEAEHPDYIRFRFVDGVRDLLLDSMPTNETTSVMVKVSAFIQHRLGQSSDFDALLHHLSSDSEFVMDQQMQPFAFIMAKVLRRLGGEYVSLANKMEQRAEDITLHAPSRLNNGGISRSSSGEQKIEVLPSVRKIFLDDSWCGLKWTKWIAFDSPDIGTLPVGSGIYRVKVIGDHRLMYIGSTTRNVRERVRSLISNTMSQYMPFNDPHTAASALWAWHDDAGVEFECSAASVSLPSEGLEALSCYLLWQYRLEQGHSTFCNHGRFHPGYVKSGNRKTQNRGYRLPDGQVNPSGGSSLPPLRLQGSPIDSNWMGVNWSNAQSLQTIKIETIEMSPGVYKIIDGDTTQLLFIGSTSNLRNRLQQVKRRDWLCRNPLVSFAIQPDAIYPYQLHELENDLVGGYYEQTKAPPKFQFILLEAGPVAQPSAQHYAPSGTSEKLSIDLKPEEDLISLNDLGYALRVDPARVRRWVEQGALQPDVSQISEGRTNYYFRRDRIEQIRQTFGILSTPTSSDEWKQEFLDFAKSRNLSRSYKPVMIKAFFQLVDREGKVRIDDLVKVFRDYYVQQVRAGQPLERSSSLMVDPFGASDQAIKRLIITNPLERFLIKNFIVYDPDEGILQIAPQLWRELHPHEVMDTLKHADEQLRYYISRQGT